MRRIVPIIAACSLALSALSLRANEEHLVLRLFPLHPSCIEYIVEEERLHPTVEIGGDQAPETTQEQNMMSFYRKCGLTFPPGSYLRYSSPTMTIYHYNTEHNQLLLGQLLKPQIPSQVQFDALFVDFPHGEIEALARTNASPLPRSADILRLWQEGKGTLLHALKLITRSGVNAQIQSTPEHIYATEFLPPAVSHTADQASSHLPIPAVFETRETGAIFNVTPCVGPDGYTIDVVMAIELAADPAWQALAVSGTDVRGNELRLSVPQPRFHSRNFTTSIVTTDGDTLILGGMANPAGDGITYLFLTVSLIESPYPPEEDYAGDPPTGGAHALR